MGTELIRSPIFLSASIPTRERAAKYWTPETFPRTSAAVRGLLVAALPRVPVVFGGHPAIVPMVWRTIESLGKESQDRVMLYQSLWFENNFVPEVYKFPHRELIKKRETRDASLQDMREAMLSPERKERQGWQVSERAYSAGVFIGGMEGIEYEYELFRRNYSDIPMYPVVSTGGASQFVYEKIAKELPDATQRSLKSDLCYEAMFKDVFNLWRT